MNRVPKRVLLVAFLTLITAVPLFEAVIDVKKEGEPMPFALTLLTRAPTEENLRRFEEDLEQGSFIEQSVRPHYQLAQYLLFGELGEKALRGRRAGWFFYTPGVRYLVEPYYADLATADRRGPMSAAAAGEQDAGELAHDPVAVIESFSRQLSARGVELLVVPIPGKASIYPDVLVEGAEPAPRVAANTLRFIRALKGRGIHTLNLHQVLLDHRRAMPHFPDELDHQGGQALYMRSDTHWSGLGARLAAEAAARWVRGRPWYGGLTGEAETLRYSRREVKVNRRGDVPRMTRIPEQEWLFDAEAVTCFKVFITGGELKGEPYEEPDEPAEAPVLVLGDSFSRVFQLDEPEAAGWIANLAFELQLPVTSIVNDGGASTLVRQELARDLEALEGKRLVIWGFVERDVRFGMQGWQPIELWPQERTQ